MNAQAFIGKLHAVTWHIIAPKDSEDVQANLPSKVIAAYTLV